MACLQYILSIEVLLQVSLPDFKISCVGGWLFLWWIQEKFPEADLKDATM